MGKGKRKEKRSKETADSSGAAELYLELRLRRVYRNEPIDHCQRLLACDPSACFFKFAKPVPL